MKFWGEAISTVTHLINLTPSKVLQGLTPHEVLFGSKPSYTHLRVFGASCYVHRNARDKDKVGDRSRRCIFVGYPFGKKDWRVCDLDNNEFFVSQDVVFHEDIFPWVSDDNGNKCDKNNIDRVEEDWRVNSEMSLADRGSLNPVVSTVNETGLPDRGSQGANTEEETPPVAEDKTEETQSAMDSSITEVPLVTAVEESNEKEVVPLVIEVEESSEKEVVKNVELGRGQRENSVPAKFKDYTLYNACCDPHHTLIRVSIRVYGGSR